MARADSTVQRALTIITPLRVADDRDALAACLRRHGGELEVLSSTLEHAPERAARHGLDAVSQLHFLSWFILAGERGAPPSLVMEASFDGSAGAFLAALVADARCKALLDEIYAFCDGYPGLSTDRTIDYLRRHNVAPELFYVGCPGHGTRQIQEEVMLAASITRHAGELGPPRGRRLEHIRRLWGALEQRERAQVCNAPDKPFWVRYVLREHKLKAFLVVLGTPLAAGGLLSLLFMALHWQGVPLWHSLVPPPAVFETTAYAARLGVNLAAIVLGAWLILLAWEEPKDLTIRMRWRVRLAKIAEMLGAILAAMPAVILLLGIVALLTWKGRAILAAIELLSWIAMVLSAAFAMGLVLISLPQEPGWRTDPRLVKARYLNLLIAGVTTFVTFMMITGLAALLKLYGDPVVEAYGYPLLALVSFAGAVGVGLVLINQLEFGDDVIDMRWTPSSYDPRHRRHEDLGAQNHFISVTDVKPGMLRALTLPIVLRITHALAQMLYDRRGLAGIPSIHFARWQLLKGRRRLLFVTNYDGAWGGYLGDFVAFAAFGMNAIWGNSSGFPRTFYLFADGVDDEQRFKFYARASQVETLFWFRRYPHVTVAAIKRNAALRDELARFAASLKPGGPAIAESDLDAYLRRFSAPGR